MLRLSVCDYPGQDLATAVKRMSDGLYFDFSDNTFKSSPTTHTANLTEEAAPNTGSYELSVDASDRTQFPDGEYRFSIYNQADLSSVVDHTLAVLIDGDTAPLFTSASEPAGDPSAWSAPKKLLWLFLRFWTATKAGGTITVGTLAGGTSTTQTYTNDDTTETIGPVSS